MARHFQLRGIKADKPYSVDELAEVASVSTQTVRNWLKAGMDSLDANLPTLILGFQALAFLKNRKRKAKRPLALGEFYCLRCKEPRRPFGAMADYIPLSAVGGRLMALCDDCECVCNRTISARDLPEIRKILDVKIRDS